jgi:hypothetical protein
MIIFIQAYCHINQFNLGFNQASKDLNKSDEFIKALSAGLIKQETQPSETSIFCSSKY